ncbi:MAG TPA: dihydropteroate synthase [Kiritimatiellia bacterium]|nr:dihydropteroate synthase [Kiritimatiellia bacterium]
MSLPGLTIIGESINDSIPSTHALFEARDLDAIARLAQTQAGLGAAYIDVNVGPRAPDYMAEVVRAIQSATTAPLSLDSPDPLLARAALEAYDPAHGVPILNSSSPLRMEMFELIALKPFRPILLASETVRDGMEIPCRTAEETVAAAALLLDAAHRHGIANHDCILDPGIAPLGTDTENNIHRLMGALRIIRDDPAFTGVHLSVGLSNFTVMLPPRRADGSPIRSALASAFLTRAMPLGLDMIIGSVKTPYTLLPEGHPALQCFDECLAADGFDVLERVQAFCE